VCLQSAFKGIQWVGLPDNGGSFIPNRRSVTYGRRCLGAHRFDDGTKGRWGHIGGAIRAPNVWAPAI